MNQFNLLRDANVKVTRVINPQKQIVAEILVNDEFVHQFPSTSRVSKHLEMMTADDLSDRLTGGSYFFIEDELVDFRDSSYSGFIHTDNTVNEFINLLGYQRRADMKLQHASKKHDNASQIILRKVWNDQEISVPGYQSGGDFKSQLSFTWNPYVKTVNSAFDLVRLICENGMVGMTSFMNNKIPLMNRWSEHLDIASRQIQNKVNDIVINRVQQMGTQRASVGDCLLLEQHAYDRLYAPTSKGPGEREYLHNIVEAVSPSKQLGNVYQHGVFHDKNVAAQLPSHLTVYDLFNVSTELRTHTESSAKSSDFALDKFSNTLLFDYQNKVTSGRFDANTISSFSSAETAFFGHTKH